jgi:hypothetical protein
MRFSFSAPALACGLIFLAACSGGSSTTAPGSATPAFSVVPQRGIRSQGVIPADLRPPLRLAVTNFSGPSNPQGVAVLNRSYRQIRTIADNIPAGDSYDSNGNLYVANPVGPNVTEYDKLGVLTFTYSSGLIDPSGVAVDGSGNVYVADWNTDQASVVVEYPQNSNTPLFSCNTGLANTDVAVEKNGNVFVAGDTPGKGTDAGFIVEFKHGLSGCKVKTLGARLGNAEGLVIDNHRNLVAADETNGGIVDIIPPPYTAVGSMIKDGIDLPFAVALNGAQSLIYVVNYVGGSLQDVVVDTYPGGTNVTTLGGSNGITGARGVAAYR